MEEKPTAPEELDTAEELYLRHAFTVDPGQEPMRLDRYLQLRLSGISRNKVQAAVRAECVLVGGRPQKASYKVKPLDQISVLLPNPPREIELRPEPIPLTVVYQDEDLLVVDKQPGLVVHPGVGNPDGTLVNALLYHLQGVASHGQPAYPHLVHRIDKDTSGLLLVALNEEAQAYLARQFFFHTIERRYRALVWGDLADDSGTIDGNLGRAPQDRRTMCVYPNDPLLPPDEQRGKHAVTHWRVLERFGYTTLVECRLETGRTHQIRAHMRHIGHPLFNDAAYGGDAILKGTTFSHYRQFVDNCFTLLPRQALHAFELGFDHPADGRHLHFESPLPPDFAACLDRWRTYTATR